jgi:hypothetical protein
MSERHVGAALLAAAGAINAAPGIGAFSGGRIRSAYGLDDGAGGPDLDVLLRHRAVLFLVTGGLLVAAAVARPHLRTAAVVTNATSSAAFVLLAATAGPVGAPLVRIAWIDVGVLGLLAGGSVLLRPAPDPVDRPG